MEQNPIAFKSKLGGYKKEDVNKYILEENKKFIILEEELQAKIQDLSDQNESLVCKNAELTTDISEKDDTIYELEQNVKSLEKQIEVLLENQSSSSIDDEETLKKANEYDKISAQIDSIIEYAKQQAEDIISNAKEMASSIKKEESDNTSERIKTDINKKATSIISDIKKLFGFGK